MEKVSQEYIDSFNSDVREVKGYVEIIYDNADKSNVSVIEVPEPFGLCTPSSLLNDKRKSSKIATLEENYTLLDGSFILANKSLKNDAVYISKYSFMESDKKIILSNTSNTATSGITIYFEDNLAIDFNITINDETIIEIVDNTKNVFQYIFEEKKIIQKLEIELLKMEYVNRRIRISEIDFGLTDVYSDNKLIKFDIDEELDLFIENIPINTCSVEINNYYDDSGDLFDPINPQGIVRYLNNNVLIRPFLGIVTENNGIEYNSMGYFYLKDWNSSSDSVTLNSEAVTSKIKDKNIIANSSFFQRQDINSLANIIQNTVNIKCNFINYSEGYNNQYLQDSNLFEYMKRALPMLLFFDNFTTFYEQYRIFYTNRNGQLIIKELDTDSVSKIYRTQMLDKPTISNVKKLGVLNIKYPSSGIYSNYRNYDVVNEFYTLNNTEEYVWFKTDKFISSIVDFNYSISSGNASATLMGNTSNMILVKINGNVGASVHLVCTASIADTNKVEKEISIIKNKDGDTLSLDFLNYFNINTRILEKLYFGLDRKCNISLKTIGNPAYEIGDTLSLETMYGDNSNINMIITKQHFSYDGGLSCTLEGVGE